MATVELVMPKMGESIFEATILHWMKKPGDKIEQDESVLEVATDKVDTEVPSTHPGILKELLAKEGDVVKVGTPIAVITTEADVEKSSEINPAPKKTEPVKHTSAEPVHAHASNGNGASHA